MDKVPEQDKELAAAILILEKFAGKKELFLSRSLLVKTMSFAKNLLSHRIEDDQSEIPRAIEVIKKYAHLLPKMAQGDIPQRQLARSAYSAVARFNAIKEQSKKTSLPWRRWMDKLSIEIPRPNHEKTNYTHTFQNQNIHEKFPFVRFVENSTQLAPSKQELDAFRMKAITLLKHQAVYFTSLTDQLNLIREVPITIKESTPHSKSIVESIVAMHQTISALPGETIELKGSFKRHLKEKNRSCPIPDSFHIHMDSKQTGHPHASQHNGWAIPYYFIHDPMILEKMKEVAEHLMPNGKWNARAKELLKLKQHIFEIHRSEFLNLHRQICAAVLKNSNDIKILDNFYGHLQEQKKVYSYLSEINQSLFLESSEVKFEQASVHAYIAEMKSAFCNLNSILESLAIKHFNEFVSELENNESTNPKWMESWIRDTLYSDLALV